MKVTISLAWHRSITKVFHSKEFLNKGNCPILITPKIFDRVTKKNATEDGSLNESSQRNTEVLESGDRNNNSYSDSPTNGPDVENPFRKGLTRGIPS